MGIKIHLKGFYWTKVLKNRKDRLMELVKCKNNLILTYVI